MRHGRTHPRLKRRPPQRLSRTTRPNLPTPPPRAPGCSMVYNPSRNHDQHAMEAAVADLCLQLPDLQTHDYEIGHVAVTVVTDTQWCDRWPRGPKPTPHPFPGVIS